MSKVFELSLGIMTAVGGFVDIGEVVFATDAGARYGLNHLWTIPVGVILIVVYSEMAGRVASVTGKPVFVLIRDRFGFTVGLCSLVASNILNVLTCAAEIGGVAFVLRLISGMSYGVAVSVAVLVVMAITWVLPFSKIEKVFGFGGLAMLVFVVAAVASGPNWGTVASSFVPHVPRLAGTSDALNYAFYAVGLIGATVMPYEVYFYSSGTIEDGRKPAELYINTITTVLGFTLGSILTVALIVLGATTFLPNGVVPNLVGSSAIGAMLPFGQLGILLAAVGLFFAIAGASIETSFAGAYNLAQFFGWPWGKHKNPLKVPRFTLGWVFALVIALAVLTTGIDPVQVTEYAVILSIVVLPVTYLPILLVANDRAVMGEHANASWQKALGWSCLVVITLVGLAAVPLMYLTHSGQG
ncbi:MAG: hypothetical protein DLM71_07720 [Chloroflexi bacterium]|nr:MAG: hypothetical protein DLM71_07720 [Chloroflexota bacterium]